MKKMILFILMLILIISHSIMGAGSSMGTDLKSKNNEDNAHNPVLIEINEPVKYIMEKSDKFQNIKNPSVALALGGGGARSFINIGVIKALEENNIPIDMVSGTSMGSIIAILYGSGLSIADIEELIKSNTILSLFEFNYPFNKSIIKTEKFNYIIEQITPSKSLEDFPLPTALLSLNLTNEARYIHTSGNVSNIIGSSYAIPFLFPVYQQNDSYFIDPGMMELTPALACHLLNADMIISTTAYDKLPYDKYSSPVKAALQYITILKEENSRQIVDKYSDVKIEANVGEYSFMDFQMADKFIEIGYQQTIKQIPEIKKILAEKGIPQKNKIRDKDTTDIQQVINDIKNERIIWDFTNISPAIYYGKNHSLLKNNIFLEKMDKVQYEIDIEQGRLLTKFYTEGSSLDNYQFLGKFKKIKENIDLQLIYSYNTDTSGDRFKTWQGSLIYYPDASDKRIFGFQKNIALEDKKSTEYNSAFLMQDYSLKYNKTELEGYFKLQYNLDAINDNVSGKEDIPEKFFITLANRSTTPLNNNWQLNTKLLYTDNKIDQTRLYRGNFQTNANLQLTLETNYIYDFEYSVELFQALQLSYLNFYQFIDLSTDRSYKNIASSLGTGVRSNLNLIGIKPLTAGAYISYDIKDKNPGIALELDLKF